VRQFFDEAVAQAQERKLLSDEHFTVDKTLIEAADSLKCFKHRDQPPSDESIDDPGNPTVNSHGEKWPNKTHRSTPDPEARLFKKGEGKEAKLCFPDHALMENRHGLPIDFQVSEATGTAEHDVTRDCWGGPGSTLSFHDPRRRQELRHGRLRRRHPRLRRDSARRPEHQWTTQCLRQSDHPPPRLRRQPADPQAGRNSPLQVTKMGVQAGLGRRDHVPDLDVALGDHHAINQQVNQLAALGEAGLLQAHAEPLAQGAHRPGDGAHFD
jgi:hypothetical protein